MSFKKLDGCDSSDMNIWADSAMAGNFLREVDDQRKAALGRLIKKPTEENAAIVRSFDFVKRLFEDARNMK